MKTLLNLKGLCRSSQLAVNPDSQPTVNRRSRLMSIICLFLLTLGTGQMWANATLVVGCAADNPNDYQVKLGVQAKDWGVYQDNVMTKAGLTFEGKKLYITSYNTTDGKCIGSMRFAFYNSSDDSWPSTQTVLDHWTEKCSYYINYIYNYDESGKETWYEAKTIETGARFYFDATGWSETAIKLVVGHANHQKYSSLEHVDNTNLYYGNSGNRWTDAMGIGVVGNTKAAGGDVRLTDVSANAKEYTGFKNYGLTSTSDGNAYLMVNNGNAGEEPTMSYHASHYANDALNYTLTMKYAVSTNGATPAELTSGYVPANITVSTYKFVSGTYNSVSSSSLASAMTKNGLIYSSTATAARTAATTFTVSNIDDDYAFLGWYTETSGGTLLSSEESYTTYLPTASATIYARFSHENNHSVTISRYCTSTSTEINSTSAKVGEITYSEISAPVIPGYTFTNWSYDNGISVKSGDTNTSNPIHIKTLSSGTYTLTANYTEVLTTDWHIIGNNSAIFPNGWDSNDDNMLMKASGASTGSVAGLTLNVKNVVNSGSESTYQFKVYNLSESQAYGYGTGGTHYWLNRSNASLTVSTSGSNTLYFIPDCLGEYPFSLDWSGSYPVLTVTFPTAATVTFGNGTGGSSVTATYSGTSFGSGTKVQQGKKVTFTQEKATGYRFVKWYTNSTGTGGTELSTATTYDYTVGATNNVYAIYEHTTTTISFNADGGDEITNQTATYGSAMPNISKPTKAGYVLVGIYDAEEGGTQYYDKDGASARTWDKEDASTTLYVRWAKENTVSIAAKKDGVAISEFAGVSPVTANTTLPVAVSAPVIPGYTFANWTLGEKMAKTDADLTANPIHITATAASTLTANYTYTSYNIVYPGAEVAHCVYGDGNSVSVSYNGIGTFTVTPAPGYSITVSATDESGAVSLSQNGDTYSFTQGTSAVEITITPTELTNTITVINGNVLSVTAKVATGDPATVTAAAAPEGKKFDHWAIDDAITLTSGTTINNRTISFHASRDTRISAVYVDRETKTVHFAKPFGWSTVTAIFSNNGSDPSSKKTAVGEPMTYEEATYYTFSYFVDDNGEGGEGDKTAQAAWNQVVFSEDGSHAIDAISFTDGNYYAKGVTEGRATPFAEWYLRGDLNGTANWGSGDYYLYPFEVDGTTATYAYGATDAADKQYFRIYRTSTGQWFRTTSQTENKEITPSEFGNTITMAQNGDNADFISTGTSETRGVYLFELTNINSATPSLKVTHPEDTKYTASVSAGTHGTITDATRSINQLGRYMPTAITATADAGYRFKEWVTTGGAVVGEPTNASTTATATADGTITATFTNEGIVYLDLSAISGVNGWNENHPYVYFYSSSYWNDTWGSGSMNILSGGHAMTRIGATNIWYYDYTSDPGVTRTTNVIAFTDKQKNGQNYFYQCNAIYRSDFYPELNMFVPQEYRTNELNNSAYYNRGYWMKYNEAEAGYRLRIYDGQANKLQQVIPFVDTDYHDGDRNEYTATLHVDGSATARFELIAYDQGTVNGHEYSGTYYGNNGTINSSLTGSGWNYEAGGGKQTTINLNSSGDYVFTLNCHTDGQLWVKVTYPLAVGDFRVKYNGLRTTTDGSKSDVYSDEIPRLTEDGTRTDKVSFFVVNADGGNAPSLSLEKVSNIDAPTGAVTWAAPESGVTFSAKEGTNIASLASGVYVFEITQTKSGANYTLTYENKGAYEGNYYIRTDYADGGWVSYKQDANKLNRTTNENAGYTDYFCRFVNAGKNVKFCIANDYNSTLTEVKTSDGLNADAYGNLTVGANTRFEYNIQTNAVGRSYIGASNVNTFLYIVDASSSSKIFQTNGTALTAETRKFADQENWIYMLDVQVTPGAEYQLRADINSNLQYFDGTATKKTLIGGTGANQNMRLVYDFKNNHLIKAWMPGAAVSGSIAINADVMLIRENQEGATQLSFADASSELTSVQKVYGVLGFTKSVLTDGTKSSQQRSLYWISFPFDVKLKDIFGFGKYGEDYIIRRYNGEKRARIGWFAETSTFWETMDPDSEIEAENTMKAYEGYMVALDKGLFSSSDSRWIADGKAISEIYLYFPSEANVGTLKQETTTITLPAMIYPYDRYFTKGGRDLNHRETDSNWRVIGVGSLKNSGLTATDLNGTSTGFDFYSWEASDNSLAPVANAQTGGEHATTFNAGHAVMVQWAGKITWTNASVPSSVAARRMPENKSYSVELDLNYDGKMADRTYVIMKEDASADFVLNEDLYKVTNANKPNIYAYAGNYDCGISRVPVESQTVPVGVITRKNGTYTFSMPTNFDGTVTLIDKFAQTRTNLALEDYEVALPKGTINDRFELELNIRKVPTAIDGVTDGNGSLKDGKAHKFIENGAMYILREGQIYDARGNKVK